MVAEVSEAVLPGVLRAAGIDLATVRAARRPVVRDLPGVTVRVEMKDSVLSRLTAPNTVGILPGSDPALRDEYLVFSAHMDHIGVTPGVADSINNGADDDASGTAGIIELAEAFSRPGARQALADVPYGERRGEGALGQSLLQRAPGGPAGPDRGRTSTST